MRSQPFFVKVSGTENQMFRSGFKRNIFLIREFIFPKKKCLTIGSQSDIASLVRIKGPISIAVKFIINLGHYKKLKSKSAGIPFLHHFNLTFLQKRRLPIFQRAWTPFF